MELFKDDGHFTREGLSALISGGLDELGRLEAAEHLAFCDACLVQYTAMLENAELLSPQKPLKQSVFKRIRRSGTLLVFKKYATVAAAACMAIIMWNVVNVSLVPAKGEDLSFAQGAVTDFLNQAGENIAGGVSGMFNFFAPQIADDAFPENTQAPAEENEKWSFANIFNFAKTDNKNSEAQTEGSTVKKEPEAKTEKEEQKKASGEDKYEKYESKFITPAEREEAFKPTAQKAAGDND